MTKLTKARARALEKVFEREIFGGPVPLFQSKAKVYRELADDGMVEETTVTLGGRFPVTVTGWSLTHRGHITYCQWASAQEDAE